jgi:hypothetical protein
MAKYTFAELPNWARQKEEVLTRIVANSFQDTLEAMQESARGMSAGGALIDGKIPVVTADLINSQVSELDGTPAGAGASGYVVALAGFTVGDAIRNAWTVEYAMRVHEGFTGTDALGRAFNQPGWHWVSVNAARFPEIVEKNVRLYGDT